MAKAIRHERITNLAVVSAATVAATIAFDVATHHQIVNQNWSALGVMCGLSLVLCAYREVSGSSFASMACHFGYNGVLVVHTLVTAL